MSEFTSLRARRAFVLSTFVLLSGCGGGKEDTTVPDVQKTPPPVSSTPAERPLVISVVAGDAVQSGSADGPGSAARFSGPSGIAVDGDGNLYVVDSSNSTIRKITPVGQVSTLAGTAGVHATEDGAIGAGHFSFPEGLAIDAAGNLFVTDNMTIRKVSSSGLVSTAATLPLGGMIDGRRMSLYVARGVAVSDSGDLFVTTWFGTRKITASGKIMIEGIDTDTAGSNGTSIGTAPPTYPRGITIDSSGTVYVADLHKTVSKIGPEGKLAPVAGTPDTTGDADGTGTAASFTWVTALATDKAGNLYAVDDGKLVRKITPAGVVTTFAGTRGSDTLTPGALPGSLAYVRGIAVDKKTGIIYATSGNAIIKIAPAQ